MTLTSNTFIGEYQYSLDSKGRINIPAKFRQSLSKDNDNTLVATRGQDPCIWIYPIKEWKKIEDELRKLSSISGIHRTFVRQIARSATPSTCDKQGRIIISPSLLSYAELNKEALILGMINKIEIWNPDILEKVDKNNINDDPNEFNSLAEKIVI
ncbi:MAG: division/cell wall cluster transcriptional repressor MraZ [Chloroflexota bacterium]|nr:division/cell wall cluster transcriptional repressor MraZ [Chloroflexota bacterium]|tara:strand:+ start:197 stop:661 length:465 start_codon:yes stop_codon:yes gene_type:complete